MKTVNIKDVAKEAGVGVGSVSRYLNNPERISDTMKEKIRVAIEKTGYVRNELGRNLKTNNPRNVALLIPSVFHNFFSAFAFYLEQALSKHDYKIMICNSLNNYKKDKYYIDMLEQGKLSGIVGFTFTEIDKYIHEGMKFISIDRDFNGKVTRVSSNNFQGGMVATEKLIKTSKLKKIGFIGTYTNKIDTDVKNRRNGFVEYATLNKIDYEEFLVEDPIVNYDEFITTTFDKLNGKIDAVFVENDNLALSFMEEAKKRNVRVPEDLSIIGYDGNSFNNIRTPRLSTIEQPISKMVDVILEELLAMIEGENYEVKDLKVDIDFFDGDTVRK